MKIVIPLLFILISTSVLSQNVEQPGCTLFNRLKAGKKIDTVTIKAVYKNIFMLGPGFIPDNLIRKKILNGKYFHSAISFKLKGCNKEFQAPLHKFAGNDNLFHHFGSMMWLTCVVFKDYEDGMNYTTEDERLKGTGPYFIVIRVTRRKPAK